MKKLILILCVILSGLSVKAQQEPIYSQYMFNTLAINPAYAGSRDVISITGLYRNQWIGIEGAPVSQTLSGDFALNNKRVGLGAQIYNDKIGVSRNIGFFTSYAYRIPIYRDGMLALGLQAGLTQFYADLTSVKLSPILISSDNSFNGDIDKLFPNFGAGVYYNTHKYYVGLSIPHLLNNNLSKYSAQEIESSSLSSQYRHLFLSAGYVFKLNEIMALKPSFLMKAVKSAPLQFDFNANMWFYDLFSVGISYRTGDAVVGLLELQIKDQLRFGYAYDYTVSKLNQFTSGSHEIMLRYEFGYVKKRMTSPRYF